MREISDLSSIAGWHYRRTLQHSVSVGTTSSDNFVRLSSRWRWKLQEPQLWRLFPGSWITAVCCSTGCSLCWMPHDAVIISRWYYANSIGYPSEIESSSKWHAWFARRCPDRRLSTWPTTAVSCPTALGALCGQLTFRLAWCHEHSAVMATERSQLWDLACETLPVQLRNPDITYRLFRRQLKGHLFREARTRRSVTSDMWLHRKTLTCLFTRKVKTSLDFTEAK